MEGTGETTMQITSSPVVGGKSGKKKQKHKQIQASSSVVMKISPRGSKAAMSNPIAKTNSFAVLSVPEALIEGDAEFDPGTLPFITNA